MGVFTMSAIGALLLAIYPLPSWLQPLRADWLALFVVYWVLRSPERFGILAAWTAGLLFDGLVGGVLGKHALALATVAYGAIVLRSRMLLYSLPQQMVLIFALTGVHQLLCQWAQNITGHVTPSWLFLAGSISSALIWPLLVLGNSGARRMDQWEAAG